VEYKTGKIVFEGNSDIRFNIKRLYVDGVGWDTVAINYIKDTLSESYSKTITGMTNPDLTDMTILCKRFDIDLVGTVAIADTTKEITLHEILVEYEVIER